MYKLELSEQMMGVIASALGSHPYREAAPVIHELQRQINNQRMPMPPTNGKMEQPEEQRINNDRACK